MLVFVFQLHMVQCNILESRTLYHSHTLLQFWASFVYATASPTVCRSLTRSWQLQKKLAVSRFESAI